MIVTITTSNHYERKNPHLRLNIMLGSKCFSDRAAYLSSKSPTTVAWWSCPPSWKRATTELQSFKTCAEYNRGVTARIIAKRSASWLHKSNAHNTASLSAAVDDAHLCL